MVYNGSPGACCSSVSLFTALVAPIEEAWAWHAVVCCACSTQNASDSSDDAFLTPAGSEIPDQSVQLYAYHFTPAIAAFKVARVCWGWAGIWLGMAGSRCSFVEMISCSGLESLSALATSRESRSPLLYCWMASSHVTKVHVPVWPLTRASRPANWTMFSNE